MTEFINTDGQIAWIAEQTGLPPATVQAVLELEMDCLFAVGIADSSGYEARFYDPSEVGPSNEVDTSRLSRDAEAFLEIPREVANQIFLAELEFLQM